jgi:hypothetical protein
VSKTPANQWIKSKLKVLNPREDYIRDKDIMECESDGKKEDEIEQASVSLSTQETGQSHLIIHPSNQILITSGPDSHPRKPSSLAALPIELVLKIFDGLNRVASACLGLTCTTFYRIHKSLHGKVPLVSFVQPSRNRIYESTDSLCIRLKKWMGPGYAFDHARKRFVKVDYDGNETGLKGEGRRAGWSVNGWSGEYYGEGGWEGWG